MPAFIILILYGILVLIYATTCFFIVYHLVNYSVSSALKTFMLMSFIILSLGLLSFNALIFFSIDWNSLIAELNIIS